MIPSPVGQHSPVKPNLSQALFALHDAELLLLLLLLVSSSEEEETGAATGASSVVDVVVVAGPVGTDLLEPTSVGYLGS